MNQRAKKRKACAVRLAGISSPPKMRISLCSDHCKTIDLGKWASGVYRISSPVLDPELLEEIEGMRPRSSGDE